MISGTDGLGSVASAGWPRAKTLQPSLLQGAVVAIDAGLPHPDRYASSGER